MHSHLYRFFTFFVNKSCNSNLPVGTSATAAPRTSSATKDHMTGCEDVCGLGPGSRCGGSDYLESSTSPSHLAYLRSGGSQERNHPNTSVLHLRIAVLEDYIYILEIKQEMAPERCIIIEVVLSVSNVSAITRPFIEPRLLVYLAVPVRLRCSLLDARKCWRVLRVRNFVSSSKACKTAFPEIRTQFSPIL